MDESSPLIRPRRTAGLAACAALTALLALVAVLAGATRLHAAVPAPTQQEPASPTAAALALTMAVGLQPGVCAADTITIAAGTRVFFCYAATNAGDVTFENHLITDRSLEPVYAAFAESMPPGATVTYTTPSGEGRLYDATTTVHDLWTANSGPGGDLAQASATVTVNVVNPGLEVITRVGAQQGQCADTTSVSVPSGSPAQFCVHLKNTGNTPIESFSITVTVPASATSRINVTGTIASHPLLPLMPDGVLDVVDTTDFSPSLSGSLLATNVRTGFSTVATVRAATVDGFPITPPNATAVVEVGRPDVTLTASVNTAATCAATTSISVITGQPFYYCLRVQNSGDVSLTQHTLRSATPRIAASFTYTLAPQASMVITNGFLMALGQPAVMGPHVYTSATTVSTSFQYTATNSAQFSITKTSGTVSAGIAVPTATPSPTVRPTDAPPTNTPWPTLSPTPSWTPSATWTPTWTPVPPSATPTRDWAASYIATPTPNFALQGAGVPDANAAAQQTADAAAIATNAALGMGASSPFQSPLETSFGQSPLDPNATPDTLSLALPVGTPAPRALFFLPTATLTPEPTPTATIRPFAPPPPAAPPGAGGFIAGLLNATMATVGLLWFIAGTVIFFGAAGIMGVLLWRDAAQNRALRRSHRYDLEPDAAGLVTDFDLESPQIVVPPEDVSAAVPAPRARPPAQDDTHWPASLP